MAGHSHWANIAIKKGRMDVKKSKLFGKLSRAIIVAVKHGGSDPATNLALRYAIDKAKQGNMPKENIERVIKKAAGEGNADDYSEVLYEGYGPGGVAVLCEILTDNRNRTAGEIRKIFEVYGGNLGGAGCVAWMFDRKGLFVVPKSAVSEERLFEVALEAGADDVKAEGESYEVLCAPDVFQQVADALEQAGLPTEAAEISRIPQNTVELDGDTSRKVLKLMDALEDQDDVQNVTANFNIPDEILAEVMSQS